MLLRQLLPHTTEVIAIRLGRAYSAPPATDEDQTVANSEIVIGIITILRLVIVVLGRLLELIPQETYLPHQLCMFLLLLFLMTINFITDFSQETKDYYH